jgi:hypothetical protein
MMNGRVEARWETPHHAPGSRGGLCRMGQSTANQEMHSSCHTRAQWVSKGAHPRLDPGVIGLLILEATAEGHCVSEMGA